MNGVRKAKRKGIVPQQRNKQSSIYAPEPLRLKYIEAYLHALIRDAKCIFQGHYSNADATLDSNRITSRLRAEGSGFATHTLPGLAQGMFSLKEHGVASFPQFRLQRGTEHPAFLGRLFNLALYSVDLNLRVKAVNFIYTFSVSFKKLKGDYPVEVVRKLFADFCKTDTVLGQIDFFSKELRPVLEDARAQWRIFVAETNLARMFEETTPQPGPGATNSPTKKNMRYRPHVLYKQLDRVFDYGEWFYPTPYHVFGSDEIYNGFFNYSVESPTARFKAVPKTAGKPRGICIEENEMQVLQQAHRKAMYTAITNYFGDNIALRKQSVNAKLALDSSKTLEYATIDESEASDRVARLLVSYLAQDCRDVHDKLMALSTLWVVPPDEVKDEYPAKVRTNKFAPMGSALCFPVMSLVHMFLIRAIIRLSTKECTKHDCANVFVYGDDIILPAKYTETIYRELPKYGMKLNVNKSFYRSHFRESCGVHAYHGVDITPVYVKYIPYHNLADAQASAFAVEEQLFDKGFHFTAEFQRQMIEDAYGSFPYVPRGLSLAGFSRDLTDSQLDAFKQSCRVRSDKKHHSARFRITSFTKRIDKLVLPTDLDAYTRWIWTAADGNKSASHTVGDSRDGLIMVTRTVLESAIGPAAFGEDVSNLVLKQYPTANARYTHPSWFGRLQKNFAAIGQRCYL